MAYRVLYTDSFEREYDEIVCYHIDHIKSPKAAADFVDAMDHALSLLAEMPAANAISTKPGFYGLELREHLVKNYVLVYRIEEDAVYLLHLFHQSQDFARYL